MEKDPELVLWRLFFLLFVWMLCYASSYPAVCSYVPVVSPSLTQLYVKIFMPALPVSLPSRRSA